MEIGVISDTHGLMRPEAIEALRGVEHILHAGDIGKLEVLEALGKLAPVTAIRGNVDVGSGFASIPETMTVELAGRRLHLIHDVKQLQIDPGEVDAVISGHSHQPMVRERDGTLFLNPGSAGPRRFTLPIALARLKVGPGGLDATLIELEVG